MRCSRVGLGLNLNKCLILLCTELLGFFLVRGSLKSHNYLIMRSILKEKGKLDERYLPWSVIEVLLRYVEHYGIMLPIPVFFPFRCSHPWFS